MSYPRFERPEVRPRDIPPPITQTDYTRVAPVLRTREASPPPSRWDLFATALHIAAGEKLNAEVVVVRRGPKVFVDGRDGCAVLPLGRDFIENRGAFFLQSIFGGAPRTLVPDFRALAEELGVEEPE